MLGMDLFAGKKIFVYGLGKTGSTAAFALQQAGANVLVWDDKPEESASVTQEYRLQDPKTVDWSTVHILVKSPGIPLTAPGIAAAMKADVPVVSDVDLLASRSPDANYICITGTNGKSTATALVGHILENSGTLTATGGNLGTPSLSLPWLGDEGTYVLELSSYQLETLSFLTPSVGVLLNLTPDHLERHGSIDKYLQAKLKLFAAMEDVGANSGVKIMGIDQPILAKAAAKIKDQNIDLITVSVTGLDADISVNSRGILFDTGKKILDLSAFYGLPGQHNWQNVACAWAALRHQITAKQFAAGLKSFRPLPHRMERVCRTKTMTFINDSKATNDEAAAFALKSFDNIYWICGGRPKAGRVLPNCLENLKNVRAAFVIGDAETAFTETLSKVDLPVFTCGNLEKAVREAYASALQEGLPRVHILLSPACASFDQFASFEHRGDVFSSLAREIKMKHNETEHQETLINPDERGTA